MRTQTSKDMTELTFHAKDVSIIGLIVWFGVAIALAYGYWRTRDEYKPRWFAPIAIVCEIVCIMAGLNTAFNLTLPADDSLTLAEKQITIHEGEHYGFLLNKVPASDIIIPMGSIVTWDMEPKYDKDMGDKLDKYVVEGFKSLRISYTTPNENGLKETYTDLYTYGQSAQYKIYEWLKKQLPDKGHFSEKDVVFK